MSSARSDLATCHPPTVWLPVHAYSHRFFQERGYDATAYAAMTYARFSPPAVIHSIHAMHDRGRSSRPLARSFSRRSPPFPTCQRTPAESLRGRGIEPLVYRCARTRFYFLNPARNSQIPVSRQRGPAGRQVVGVTVRSRITATPESPSHGPNAPPARPAIRRLAVPTAHGEG